MTDDAITEIYGAVETSLEAGQAGIRIHIFPFRMTETNMATHIQNRWHSFWSNLKTGYDMFEANGNPPNTEVIDRTYIFNAE